ncbi:aspartyl-phosphate phosphatase Spo0E family protein [Virgibacillus kimchii]
MKYNKENGVKQVDAIEDLEIRIEQQRSKMYQAFKENRDYDELTRISQNLDLLLNKLEKMKKRKNMQ